MKFEGRKLTSGQTKTIIREHLLTVSMPTTIVKTYCVPVVSFSRAVITTPQQDASRTELCTRTKVRANVELGSNR